MQNDQQPDSAVAAHHAEEHPDLTPRFAMTVLNSGGGFVLRKCMEAVHIKSHDPELNRRLEGSGAMDLYL